MTLSVCCLTAGQAARVVPILGLLRHVADEVAVAADSRADPSDVAAYATVADRIHRVEVGYLERHVAWLHAQRSADWILRIEAEPNLRDHRRRGEPILPLVHPRRFGQ